jgi:hypothetical protein
MFNNGFVHFFDGDGQEIGKKNRNKTFFFSEVLAGDSLNSIQFFKCRKNFQKFRGCSFLP